MGTSSEVAPHVAHAGSAEEEIDAAGCIVLPGFVQAHVHLCQTLFRNLADDLELLDWLRERIWPMEAWLDASAIAAGARLGLHELISGGTTTLLDMGTVRHTDALFQAAEDSGVRYVGGKCLMDFDDEGIVPEGLIEPLEPALAETETLIERWHGAADGRLRYAVAPRFAVSCSDEMLQKASDIACMRGALIHSHANENRGEIELVHKRTGRENIDYLSDMGMMGSNVVLAHCVHLSQPEVHLLYGTGTHIAHCPSSNLKLASGFAPIPDLLDFGINVALGADGAPCNNRLSMFQEMTLAAMIHKPTFGPTAMPAARVLRMATRGGAKALGLEDEIGSIEPGKRADVIIIDPRDSARASVGDPRAAVVYTASSESVRDVLVGGRFLKRDFEVTTIDQSDVLDAAAGAWERLRTDFPEIVTGGGA